MSDITLAELVSALPAGDCHDWWAAAAALPTTSDMNEFMMKTLKGLYSAAQAKNANLAVGSKLDGYPAPTYGTITMDAASGIQSVLVTATLKTRVALNPDVATVPLV